MKARYAGAFASLALALAAPLVAQETAPAPAPAPAAAPAAPASTAGEWRTFTTHVYRGKRNSVSFVAPDHGWSGTGAGDLFCTIDGGATWEKVASRPGTFVRAVGFVALDNGFIGNIGTDYYPGVTDTTPLYRNRDGGKTWSVDISAHAGMILDVGFFDENTGIVFAATNADPAQAEGLVLRTKDGGKTRREVYRSGRRYELIWKASLLAGGETGYAAVQSYDPERATQLVIRTDDRGKTWRKIEMAQDKTARQFGVGFVSAEVGFVGTMAGGFATKDGGKTWERAPIARAANKLQAVPTDTGVRLYAIGTGAQAIDLPATPKG